MATNTDLLQGEVNKQMIAQDMEVERLLAGFLQALIREQSQLTEMNSLNELPRDYWTRKETL